MQFQASIFQTRTFGFPRFASSSTSSKLWLKRQSKDPFVKLRAQDVYRSRSAYKLLEIDDKYRVLRQARTIVDLGAAPGGWSEAAARRTRQNLGGRNQPTIENDEPLHSTLRYDRPTSPVGIVAVDLLPIASIPGVHTIQGDFLSPQTQAQVTSILDGRPVDVVLSDMCGNVSGNRDRDSESSLQLCLAAFSFAKTHLEQTNRLHDARRGVLIMKYFAHPDMDEFRKSIKPMFRRLEVFKPKSSRSDSSEVYLVCIGWKGGT